MKKYNAKFSIYRRGETSARPIERTVQIDADSLDEAMRQAFAIRNNPELARTLIPEYHPEEDVLRISPSRDVRLDHDTRKVAVLVTFSPRTRVIVDIPKGQSLDDWLESDRNLSLVAELARSNMLQEPEGYLCADNMSEVDPDEECPFGTISGDNQ